MTTLSILPYTDRYKYDLAELYHTAFSGDERGAVYTAKYFLNNIDQWMSDPTCRCFVATLSPTPVGETLTASPLLWYRIWYAHTATMPAYFEELGCRDEVERILADIVSTYSSPMLSHSIFWLDDLVVAPTSRWCGIWSQLVAHAVEIVRQSWYVLLVLYTLASDERLGRFYVRLGFRCFWIFFDHLSQRWQVIFGKRLA